MLKAANHQIIGQRQQNERGIARNNGVKSINKNVAEGTIADLT